MKKGSVWFLMIVFILAFFSFAPACFAKGTRIEVPEAGLSVLFPEDFYVVGRENEVPSAVPQEYRDKLQKLRKADPGSSIFAYSGDGLYRTTMYIIGTNGPDYTEMAGDEFVREMDVWSGAVWGAEKLIRIEPYRVRDTLFIKSVIENQGEYSVVFRTMVMKRHYLLKFDTIGFSAEQRILTEEDEAVANAMADSIIIQPPKSNADSTRTPIPSPAVPTPETPADMQDSKPPVPVTLKDLSLTFELPGNFLGIAREENTQQVSEEWRPLFVLMQPKMKETGVHYYAIRFGFKGKITQFAVTERNVDQNTLQVFFDAGTNMLDSLTGRTGLYREKPDARADKPFYVNDITFQKHQKFSGKFCWLLYKPKRQDLSFAFAYAGDGTVIAAAEDTDMNEIVQSFRAVTTRGKPVPGQISPTEYVMNRFYLSITIITGACVFAALLVVLVRYRLDKRAVREEWLHIEKNVAVIRRLYRLKLDKILTHDEYMEKKKELLER